MESTRAVELWGPLDSSMHGRGKICDSFIDDAWMQCPWQYETGHICLTLFSLIFLNLPSMPLG